MEHFRLLTSIKTKQLMLTTMPMSANPSMKMLYHSTPLGTNITEHRHASVYSIKSILVYQH